jgi:hypothetical protein
MRSSRVVPVLVATAAVLVASTAVGGTRPADGAAQDRPGSEVAALVAQDLDPMVLLYASSDPQRRSALRVEVCTLADSPDPRRTAFKFDVRTGEEPVDSTCLNIAVPPPPETADIPARTGPDREPTAAADRDYGAVTVAAASLTDVNLAVCRIASGSIPIIVDIGGEPPDDCKDIPANG